MKIMIFKIGGQRCYYNFNQLIYQKLNPQDARNLDLRLHYNHDVISTNITAIKIFNILSLTLISKYVKVSKR